MNTMFAAVLRQNIKIIDLLETERKLRHVHRICKSGPMVDT